MVKTEIQSAVKLHSKMPAKGKTVEPSEQAVKDYYNAEISHARRIRELNEKHGYKTRWDGLPEHVSENIIKFFIQRKLKDPSCTWLCKKGDLTSTLLGAIECKSFTSDGPTSFGPKQKWDIIFFLDAREWLNDRLVIWQINLQSTDEVWKSIKVNKKQSKADQSDESRRPRINWEGLKPQLGDHCKKVYEGNFEDIFKEVAPVAEPLA
jgi:hypothetical protein